MESRHEYRNTILAAMRQPAIVLSRQLRVQMANRAFLDTFRVSAKETLGQRIFEVADGQWAFPEVHTLLHLMLRDTRGSLQDVAIEHDFKRIGHRAFQISACRLNELPVDVILFALHEIFPEAKFRRLFETARDGILLVDAESAKITDANQLVNDLLGHDGEQLIGLRLWDVKALIGTPLGPAGFERVRSERVVRFPIVSIPTRHRRFVEMEVVGSVFEGGGYQAVQFNFRDITDRRRYDWQSQNEASRESLGVLAGGIAHDFNNLLLEIIGNATLALGDAPEDSPYRGELNAVITASQRAADLTDQILAYSGNSTFIFRRTDLSEVTREVTALVGRSLPEFVKLRIDLAADPLWVDADPRHLTQLVTNLVINGGEAVCEGEKGCVHVSTRLTHVEEEESIRFHLPAGQMPAKQFAVLEVEDNGLGMDPATQARVFDPFFSTKFTGRGLGLAAAMGIVKGHGGVILLNSKAGAGTKFQVFLPLLESDSVR